MAVAHGLFAASTTPNDNRHSSAQSVAVLLFGCTLIIFEPAVRFCSWSVPIGDLACVPPLKPELFDGTE